MNDKDLNISAVAKLLEASPSLSPIVVGFIIHEIIKNSPSMDLSVGPYIVFGGIAISLIILSWQRSTSHSKINADFRISKDLHTRIEDIDAKVKSKAVEGLQIYRLLSENIEDVQEMRNRAFVNTTAVNALMPSIIQNHHCVEIAKYDNVQEYLDSKVKLIEIAFNRDPYRAKYLQTIMTQLPDNVTLHKAFQSYVYTFFKEALLPALIDSCEDKIAYYKSVEVRSHISEEYKADIISHRKRNEEYLADLTAIDADSGIMKTAITPREK